MQYRQDVMQSAEHREWISIVTIRSLVFGNFLPYICESCGATYRYTHESFSALQSMSIPLTDVVNCVIGDAILPQNAAKLTKNTVLNWAFS